RDALRQGKAPGAPLKRESQTPDEEARAQLKTVEVQRDTALGQAPALPQDVPPPRAPEPELDGARVDGPHAQSTAPALRDPHEHTALESRLQVLMQEPGGGLAAELAEEVHWESLDALRPQLKDRGHAPNVPSSTPQRLGAGVPRLALYLVVAALTMAIVLIV